MTESNYFECHYWISAFVCTCFYCHQFFIVLTQTGVFFSYLDSGRVITIEWVTFSFELLSINKS